MSLLAPPARLMQAISIEASHNGPTGNDKRRPQTASLRTLLYGAKSRSSATKRRTGVEPATSSLGNPRRSPETACKSGLSGVEAQADTALIPQIRCPTGESTVSDSERLVGTTLLAGLDEEIARVQRAPRRDRQAVRAAMRARSSQFVGRFGGVAVNNREQWNLRPSTVSCSRSASKIAAVQCRRIAGALAEPGSVALVAERPWRGSGGQNEVTDAISRGRGHDTGSCGVSRGKRANDPALSLDGTLGVWPAPGRALSGVGGVSSQDAGRNPARCRQPHQSGWYASPPSAKRQGPRDGLRPLAGRTGCPTRPTLVMATASLNREQAHHG
jgi:hypothetical protein